MTTTLLDLLSRQPVWAQAAALAAAMLVVVAVDRALGRLASLAAAWALVLGAAYLPAPGRAAKAPRGRGA